MADLGSACSRVVPAHFPQRLPDRPLLLTVKKPLLHIRWQAEQGH